MDNIVKQYKALGILSLELSIIAQFYILIYVIPFISFNPTSVDLINKFVVFILSSTTLYMIVAKGPLYWFEKVGWKQFNRKFNFHGEWNYLVSFYKPESNKIFTKEGIGQIKDFLEKLSDNHGRVFIKQTVFGVSTQDGTGFLGKDQSAPITTWKANSASFDEYGTLIVNYTNTLGGIKGVGIDTYTVTKRDRGKPIEMSGHFVWMPDNTNFIFRGELSFKRVV